MITLGSLFSGSGGFELAGAINGIRPIWNSEIEPFPMRVTAARFPDVVQLGDITKIDGAKIPPVDVITGGSPCQDLSVAGKQKGIHEGERSHLFFEAIRIIKEMRQNDRANGRAEHELRPRFFVWENVPGAFSSNEGRDFQAVLQAFCEIKEPDVSIPERPKGGWEKAGCIVGDGYSVAWRVYDAQFWGVPQRRKRIYLIADFGGERAGEILFERESLCGNPAESGAQREGASGVIEGGTGGSCVSFAWANSASAGLSANENTAPTIKASNCGEPAVVAAFMGGQGAKAAGIGYSESVSPTIKNVMSGGNTVPDVVYSIHDKATRYRGGGSTRHNDGAGNGLGVQNDGVMYTLDTASRHGVCYLETAHCSTVRQDEPSCVDREPDVVAYDTTQITSLANRSNPKLGDPCHPLAAQQHPPLVVCSVDCRNMKVNGKLSGTLQAKETGGHSLNYQNPVVYDARGNGDGTTCPTLTGDYENRITDYTAICIGNGQLHQTDMGNKTGALNCMHDQQAVIYPAKPPRKYIVRRLMPLECCRLQGFPDGWDFDVEGSDSARYKMWGNGIALPCATDVLRRVTKVLSMRVKDTTPYERSNL